MGQPTLDKNPLPPQETAQMYTPDFRFIHSVSRPDKGNPPIPGKKMVDDKYNNEMSYISESSQAAPLGLSIEQVKRPPGQ